jgi:subtilisin-like proprotein convertase family protein
MRRLRSAGRLSNRLNSIREAVGASAVLARLRGRSRATQAQCHAMLIDALENRVLLSTVPGPTTTFDQNITGPTALNSNINYSSPSISYDPNNPLNVVEASVEDNPNAVGTQKIFIALAYSTNGGTTWTNISSMLPANAVDPLNSTKTNSIPYSEATDVTVGFDLDENFYVTYSEHDAANDSGAIVLQQFQFNGGAPAISGTNQNVPVYQWAGADYAYTPTMAVDTNQASFTDPRSGDTQGDPYSGNIYVAWATDDTAPTGATGTYNPDRAVMAVATPGSVSGAISFSPPMTVNTANQYQGNTGGKAATPQIVISQGDISGAITPGQVTVVWDNISSNAIESSPVDGGVSGVDYSFPVTGAVIPNADAQLFSYYDAITPGANPEPATYDPTNPYASSTEAYPPDEGTVANSGDSLSFLEADFNNDNLEDLVILDKTTGTVDIYLGVGNGQLVGDVQLTGFTNPKAIVAGDFDGDGKLDLLVVDSNGLEVFTGDGQGNFTWSNSGQPWTAIGGSPTFTDNATWNIQSAKINNDSLSDIALTDSSSNKLYVATSGYLANNPTTVGTLTGPTLIDGLTYTTIPTSALTTALASGATITLTDGGNTVTATLSAAATQGATSLSVNSFTANANYDNTTTITTSKTVATLGGTPLVSGNSYNSLQVTPLGISLASGATVTLVDGGNTQTLTLSAAAAQGATTLSVNGFTANASYDSATSVQAAVSTLSTALVNGTTYTSLSVSALPVSLAIGSTVTLVNGGNTQTVTLSAAAASGATTISVNGFTANTNYDTTTAVQGNVASLYLLTSGSTYTSLTVSALSAALPNGATITLVDGNNTQIVTLSAAAAQGATTLSVNSFVANANYDNATTVLGPTTVATLANDPVVNGTTYTSLNVTALADPIPAGTTITLGTGNNTVSVTLSAAAAKGATTISINSFTAGSNLAGGTVVVAPLPLYAFNFIAPYALAGTNPQSLVLQDVNNDNKVDAVVGDGDALGHVEVFAGSLLTATDKVYAVGSPITELLAQDVTGDNKVDITALTNAGVSVLVGGATFTLSTTNPAIAETGIVSGVYGAVESSTATDLVVINSAGYLQVLKPVVAGLSVSFTNASTIDFPTDNGTPVPAGIINYPSDAAARFDIFVYNSDTGNFVDYNVPKVQATVVHSSDFTIPIDITDPNFVVSNLSLDLAVTDADLDQVAAVLIGPDGTYYWLFLNQDVGTTPGNAVPMWSSSDTVYGPLTNDTIAQGITNPNNTPGLGYVSTSGDQLDAQFDDQAARPINDPNVTDGDYVADFRQEEDVPGQAVAAMTYWNLNADNFETLDGQLASSATVNGTWTLRFFTFEDFTSNAPVQTLDNATIIITGSTVPQGSPLPLGLIPSSGPNKIAASTVHGTLSNTGFALTLPSDPDGIGPGISVAEDNSLGIYSPYQGRIYVAFTNVTDGDPNIDLYYSDDGGGTWTESASTPVNADATNSQYSPAIAVDQATGTLVLTWYDASADSANARVAREIVTSTDGGDTFSAESYLNVSNEVYDAITGEAVNLGPIPDNISSGSRYNGTTGNDYSGFGGGEAVAAIGGHVYAVWTGNQNGGPTGNNAMDILTSTTTYADGPRVLSSTEGVVSTPEDILNPAVDNSPELQYIDITFDRPIVPADGITYDPTNPTEFPFYFDPSAITIYYRNDSTPGTSPPTSILPISDILSIEPLDYGAVGNGLDGGVYGEATTFRVAIAPQSAPGTYSYSITDPVISGAYTIADGYIYTGLGNFQAPYSISATGSDIAASTIGGDTNLPVPAPGDDTQYSYIEIPSSLPAADIGGTIVDVNVTVDLDGASDALSDLSLYLIDPNGNEIPLSLDRVGASQTPADIGTNSTIGGNGYISTVFDDQAATPVAFGNYQFSGTYKPDTSDGVVDATDGGAQGLGTFNGDTLNVGDEWTLEIVSNRTNNGVNAIGLLRDWSLQFTTATLGTYVGNPMDQNADAISGEAPQALATNLGGAATAPGTLGDAYVTPNPTSNNSYTINGAGNYFAAPYDDSTLPLIIPGPQVLTTRNYPATVSNTTVPLATNSTTPGTLTSTITIGGDSDVDISTLMIELNLSSANSVGSLVVQLIYTPVGGGVSDEIPITLTDEVAGGGSSFGGDIGGETVPTIFSDDAANSIQDAAYSSPYAGFYLPASPLSDLSGQTLAGTYQLVIRNFDATAGATLNSWSITASTIVTAVDPNSGAGLNSIDVYFSQPMNAASVEAAAVALTGPNGPITGTFTITPDPNYDPNFVDAENRTYKITFPSAVSLTGGYSLVLGTPGAEPASATGTLLDSDSNDGLEMLRDESASSTTQTVTVTSTPAAPISKFNGTDGILQSTVSVGSNPSQNFIISGVTVTLEISYPRASELSVTLIAPDGTAIQLFSNLSSTGKLYGTDSITFSDTASVPITSGSAPFLGTFSPQEPLSYLTGLLSGGTWTLQIKDNGANSGTLVSWSLKLTGALPDTGAGTEPGDDATVGFNIFNSGATSSSGGTDAISHEVWIPLMTSITAASSSSSTSASTPGPVSTIAVDPSDPSGNTVYIGAATGGVWKTTDFLTTDAAGPTYVPLTNTPLPGSTVPDALNIGSIAVVGSQTVSGTTYPSMIFAATGEFSDPTVGAADNAPGVGVLVSTDGGQTWNLASGLNNYANGSWLPLSSTSRDNTLVGTISYKIIADPHLQSDGEAIVYLAVSDPTGAGHGGLYRSTDSGQTWTLMRAGQATDVAFEFDSGVGTFVEGQTDTQNNLNNIVAAFAGDGVYFSPNRGAVWTQLLGNIGDPLILNDNNPVTVANPASPNGNNGRIALATPALTGNPVEDLLYSGWIYAVVITGSVNTGTGGILGIYMTKDNGETWTKLTLNPDYDVTEGTNVPAGTGNYDISLAVDPNDPNVIYVGGNAYANDGAGMIRIDTTGISDAHSFYQGETAADGGKLRVNTTDVASTTATPVPLYSTTLDDPTINLLQNPSQPFLTDSTIDVSDITQFGNTGEGISWIPFDSAFGGAVNYNAIVTLPDLATGGARIIVATGQGVFTGVDTGGEFLTSVSVQAGSGAGTTVSGSRNGNLSIVEIYYGAVQPSQNAADIAGALFYGNTEGEGLVSSDPNILTDGNTVWTASPVPGSGMGVATDSTGSGAVYQYQNPFLSSVGTNFFQVDDVSRTTGLFATTTGANTTHDPQWPDLSTDGNGNIGSDFAVDPIDGDQIVMSSQAGRIYATENQGESWSLISPNAGLDGTYAPAVAYGAPGTNITTGTFIYAGTVAGNFYVTFTGGGGGAQNAWYSLPVPGTGNGNYVESIVPDPNPNTSDVYVITQKGVYYLSNAIDAAKGIKDQTGKVPTWTNITGDLAGLVATTFGAANLLTTMTADWRYATPVLYVGADAGVFRGIEDTETDTWSWTLFPNVITDDSPVNGGYLPDVKVTDLDLSTGTVDPTTGLPHTAAGDPDALLASTFGQGAFAIRLAPIVASPAAAVPAALPFDKIINTSSGTTTSYITNARTLTISGTSEKEIAGFNQALISIYLINSDGSTTFLGGYLPGDNNSAADPHSSNNTANIADANGNFTITTTTNLPSVNGSYTIGIEATDNAGVVGAFSKMTVSLEVTPPAITSLALSTATDTGSSSTDGKTKINTPTIVGQGAAGATVTLFVKNSSNVTQTFTGITADANGLFSYTLPALADGTYTVTASEVDALGNQGSVSSPFTMTIVTSIATLAAPTLATASDSGLSQTDGITNVTTPTFTGTAGDNDLVTLNVTSTSGTTVLPLTTTADGSGNYSFTLPALADANYSITVTQTDVEGNVSTASPATNITIDTTPPNVFAANIITSQFGTYSGVVANYVDVDGGGSASIDWGDGTTTSTTDVNSTVSLVHVSGSTWEVVGSHAYQTQGSFTLSVTVTDVAGNTASPASATATVNPPAILVASPTVYMVEGKPFNSVISSFSSGVAGETAADFTVTSIDWGDGTTDTSSTDGNNDVLIVQDPNNPLNFLVYATHTYASSATHNYPVTVSVNSTDASATSGTGLTTLVAIPASQVITVTPLAVSTSEGSTATVNVADIVSNGKLSAADFANDFAASDFAGSTINWGDGTSSTGTIVADGTGGFYVQGSHAYADGSQTGTAETITTTVKVDGTSLTPVTGTATVANVAPTITTFTGTNFALVGQAVSFQLGVTDPGTVDQAHNFTYNINWGDGHTTQASATSSYAPSHQYTTAGTYTISVTATDKDNGVSAAVTHSVQVAQLLAEPSFGTNEGTQLTNYPVAYITGATSLPSFSTISINWGDGTTDTNSNDPNLSIVAGEDGVYLIEDSHKYADGTAAGSVYTITTSVTPTGATTPVSVTETATVANVAPTLSATPPTQAIVGQTVSIPLTVTDPGSIDTSTGFTYSVNWGDGTIQSIPAAPGDGTGYAPTHIYTTGGNYSISITATDKDSAVSNTVGSNIQVAGLTGSNISDAEGSSFSGVVATITNASSFMANNFTASINWGDSTTTAGTITSNGDGTFSITGTHTYTDGPATDSVVTTVTFGSGSGQVTSTATVSNVAPTASISGPTFALAGQLVSFTIGATDPGTADLAAGFKYVVTFGDGTSQTISAAPGNNTGTTVSHTYSSSGSYSVSVVATDKDGGASAAASQSVAIAGVNIPTLGDIPEGSTFSGTIATINDAANYGTNSFTATINWGDGTTTAGTITVDPNNAGSFLITGSHYYGDGPATYTVTVTITTTSGSMSTSAAGTIKIDNVAPTLSVSGAVGGFINQTLGLTLSATDPSSADSAAGFIYSINWGDGTTQTIGATANNGTGVVPTHTYAALGNYTVTITATDKDGGVSTAVTHAFAIVQNPQLQNVVVTSTSITFTLPQTSAPITSLDSSDFELIKDGSQNISLSGAPITFDPTTGAVSIDTTSLNLGAGDYQLYTLPGTNITPALFTIGIDESALLTKTVKLTPGKKVNAPTLHFKNLTLGGAPDAPIVLILQNVSATQPLTLSEFAFLSSGPFSFAVQGQVYGATQYTIAPGASLTVRVYYTPTVAGSSTTRLRAQFNNGQALDYGAVVGKFVGKAVNPKVKKSSITKDILKGDKS